ncbi:MAG: PQQ-binding-like beta-propeller repeat protein [Candidatus Micrarchaeota archaeon]|nr:PQQ-binding-like beta-propeller repeat protein [Candidatus Micrarchaeota archaeon]
MRAAALFLLFLLCNFSFAAVEWSFSSPTPLAPGMAFLSDSVILSSTGGMVYALSAKDGALSWSYDADEQITTPPCAVDASSIAFATKGGKVSFLSSNGKEIYSARLASDPLYIACASNKVYVAFENRLTALTSQGEATWNLTFKGLPGALSTSDKVLYFTAGGQLHAVSLQTGVNIWTQMPSAADSFLSAPTESGDTVYFGATDNNLHAINRFTGTERWSFPTGGWVISSPTVLDDTIYFGSSDGYLYAVSNSGNLRFKFKAGQGVWSTPLLHASSGQSTVVFGTTDGKPYGIDAADGSEKWSFSTAGRVNSPSEYSDSFIFTTEKGKAYSISTSPICSFSSPKDSEVVGDWALEIRGRASSDSPISKVEARANGGSWVLASGTTNWTANIDVSSLPDGSMKLECRATDSSGKSESGDFSSLSLIKMQGAPLRTVSVISPQKVSPNETFSVFVKDGNGVDLRSLSVSVGDKKTTEDSPFSLSLGKSGQVEITIEKGGYQKTSFIVVGVGESSPFTIPIVLIVAVAAILIAYKLFFTKKK